MDRPDNKLVSDTEKEILCLVRNGYWILIFQVIFIVEVVFNFEVVFSIYSMSRPNLFFTASKSDLKHLR